LEKLLQFWKILFGIGVLTQLTRDRKIVRGLY
jgi:hypothetical protein